MLNVLQRLTKLTRQSIIKFDIMQLLTNLCLLSHQLILASGLRVIDSGLGPHVYREKNVVDYALLAADSKAALPSKVQAICYLLLYFLPALQFTICSSATSDAMISVVHFFQLLRQSGDPWITLLVQPDHEVRLTVMRLHTHTSTHFHKTSFDQNYSQLRSLTQNPSI